ncbi:T9SS type A sorting domain-containing protein, partial [candidate division WOR-3 bacterium]|nr:T9SS type A sorting domain-containing protein [candidate division WOR-3 bacterium]
DRWYGNPSTTWNEDWAIVDTLHAVVPPIAADEEYRAVFDDADHPTSKGLLVRQWSGALARPGYRDFVVIEYTLENTGANPINDLHVGIFSDFDVNNTTTNRAYTDATRRLAYMAGSSGFSPTVGVKLLAPTLAANVSALDNTVHVQPSGMMTEAVKDSFLRGAISVSNPGTAKNWSVVVSAGPFNLAPGSRQKVAFAFVGGESQTQVLAAGDSAQSWYDNEMPSGVAWLKHTIDDAPPGGNGDGVINPGEAINLPLWIVNRADGPARGVRGILRKTSGDTLVTVTDSVRYFGTVGAGDSAWTGSSGFGFRVSRACTNRYRLPLVLVCVDTLDSAYVSTPALVVGAPQLLAEGVRCWDPRPGGNNNGRLDPGEQAELALGVRNAGMGTADSVRARLRSGDVRLEVLDSLGWYGPVHPDSTVFNTGDRFTVRADGSIPRETELPCTLLLTGHEYAATRVVMLGVGMLTNVDPVPDGPRQPARYWAYDDCDTFYVARPGFEWVEINGVGTRMTFSQNDAVVMVPLPSGFGPFRYYGQEYSQVSVSADGWLAPGNHTTSNYSNTALPGSSAPPGAICPNWDDLYPYSGGGGAGYVYHHHDEANHRFVVEYDSVRYYSGTIRDKFQVLIYDTTAAGPTGDCPVVFQYLTADGYTSSTVGIQDPNRTIGIQCLYNGSYHRAASVIEPGRAVRFCTDSVQTGVGEWNLGGRVERFDLRCAPNPVQRLGTVAFNLPLAGHARLTVVDLTGRTVRTLADARLERGSYSYTWNRQDDAGREVAAGVYLYRLETDAGILSRKAVLVR